MEQPGEVQRAEQQVVAWMAAFQVTEAELALPE
jgi:hypothetical protein